MNNKDKLALAATVLGALAMVLGQLAKSAK